MLFVSSNPNNLNRTEDGLERQLNFGGFHPNPNAPDNPFSVRFFAAPRFAGEYLPAKFDLRHKNRFYL